MKTDINIRIGIFVLDIVLLCAVVTFLYVLMGPYPQIGLSSRYAVPWLLTVYTIGFVGGTWFFPPVTQRRLVNRREVVLRVFTSCLLMFLFISAILLVTHSLMHFPRAFFVWSFVAFTSALLAERLIVRRVFMRVRASHHNRKQVVLVGKGDAINRIYEMMSSPVSGYCVIGVFYDGECVFRHLEERRMGGIGDLYGWLATHEGVNEIYGHLPEEQHPLINMIGKFCDNHLIRFFYVPAPDVFRGPVSFSFINEIPLIARREDPLYKYKNRFVKRAFDIVFSSLVLVLVFPWVFIIVAVIIKLQSPGPVFFRQARTGLDGKVFKCIKFRSMAVNDDADKVQATKDDPRKFPFGNLMRKCNIDELPQFVNVFLGDMSVVGPRPHMLRHTEEYSKLVNNFALRHLVKPGITGLAQVSGFRGETHYIYQMEGRVQKDIEYIENWTLLLDVIIIFRTVTNMLGREKGNAY